MIIAAVAAVIAEVAPEAFFLGPIAAVEFETIFDMTEWSAEKDEMRDNDTTIADGNKIETSCKVQ